jgi:hypothetical protein
MASQSKVVCGKNNSPSGFLLRQRHVRFDHRPTLIFLWIHPLMMAMMMTTMMTMMMMMMIPTPMHCIDIFVANMVGANFLFLLMATRETATAVMMPTTKMTMMMTTTRTTWTMFPKLPYPHWLQVVTPFLLLLAPLVEMILIGPVVLPILSNQVVTGMLLVAATTLMSCCCHALTTLCNNAFLLLTPPHL